MSRYHLWLCLWGRLLYAIRSLYRYYLQRIFKGELVLISVLAIFIVLMFIGVGISTLNDLHADYASRYSDIQRLASDTKLDDLMNTAKWTGILWLVITAIVVALTCAAVLFLAFKLSVLCFGGVYLLKRRYNKQLIDWENQSSKEWPPELHKYSALIYFVTFGVIVTVVLLAQNAGILDAKILLSTVALLSVPTGLAFATLEAWIWRKYDLPREFLPMMCRWNGIEATIGIIGAMGSFIIIIAIFPALVTSIYAPLVVRIFEPWENVVIYVSGILSQPAPIPGTFTSSLVDILHKSSVSPNELYNAVGGHLFFVGLSVLVFLTVIIIPSLFFVLPGKIGRFRGKLAGIGLSIAIYLLANVALWLIDSAISTQWKLVASLTSGIILLALTRYILTILGRPSWLCSNPKCSIINSWDSDFCKRCGRPRPL